MEKFQAHARPAKYKTWCFKTPLGDSNALKFESPVLNYWVLVLYPQSKSLMLGHTMLCLAVMFNNCQSSRRSEMDILGWRNEQLVKALAMAPKTPYLLILNTDAYLRSPL